MVEAIGDYETLYQGAEQVEHKAYDVMDPEGRVEGVWFYIKDMITPATVVVRESDKVGGDKIFLKTIGTPVTKAEIESVLVGIT